MIITATRTFKDAKGMNKTVKDSMVAMNAITATLLCRNQEYALFLLPAKVSNYSFRSKCVKDIDLGELKCLCFE